MVIYFVTMPILVVEDEKKLSDILKQALKAQRFSIDVAEDGETAIEKAKADEKGHLFSAIHEKAMVEAMKEQHRADISEKFIVIEHPIKATK